MLHQIDMAGWKGAGSIGQGEIDGCWLHWTGVDGWVLDPLDSGRRMGAGSIGQG